MSSTAVNNTPARGAGPRGGALQPTAASAIDSLFGNDAGSTLGSFADQLARAGTPAGSMTAAGSALLDSAAARGGSATAELAPPNTPAPGASAEPPTGALAQWIAEWLSGKATASGSADADAALPPPGTAAAHDGSSATVALRPASAPSLAAQLPPPSTAAASPMLREHAALPQAGVGMTAPGGADNAASLEHAAPTGNTQASSNDATPATVMTIAASALDLPTDGTSEVATSSATLPLMPAQQPRQSDVAGSIGMAPRTSIAEEGQARRQDAGRQSELTGGTAADPSAKPRVGSGVASAVASGGASDRMQHPIAPNAHRAGAADNAHADESRNDATPTPGGGEPPHATPIAVPREHVTPAAVSAPGADHRSATATAVLQAKFHPETGTWPGNATPTSAAPRGGHPVVGRAGEARAVREASSNSHATDVSDKAKAARPIRTADESTARRTADAEPTSEPEQRDTADELEVPAGAPPLALVQPPPSTPPATTAPPAFPAAAAAPQPPSPTASSSAPTDLRPGPSASRPEHPYGSVTAADERSSAPASTGVGGHGTWQAQRESPALAVRDAPSAGPAVGVLSNAPPAAERSDQSSDDAPRPAPALHASASSTPSDAATLSTSVNASAMQGDTVTAARPFEPLPPFAMAPMPQPGTAPAVQPAAEVPFATPFGAPEFQADFGAQISLLARDGVEEAELRLNPVEMGPVSVRISIDGERAQIDFGADSAATRALIEAGMPELASALREAGLTLAGGGVGEHARGQPEGRQAGGDASPHERQREGHPGGQGNRAASDDEKPAPPVRRTGSGNGRLDLYA